MITPDVFKKEIENIVSQDYKIKFLGDGYCDLTEKQAEGIYNWTKDVIAKKLIPALTQSKKMYKLWKINELLSFIKKFNISNQEKRIILIKIKNKDFIEFHMSKHEYYDKLRKQLNLTKKS